MGNKHIGVAIATGFYGNKLPLLFINPVYSLFLLLDTANRLLTSGSGLDLTLMTLRSVYYCTQSFNSSENLFVRFFCPSHIIHYYYTHTHRNDCTSDLLSLHVILPSCLSPSHVHTQEIDLKAGGGYTVTIGEMCRMMLTKLEWFGTLFPRIPVNVQKELEEKLSVAQKAAR